MGRWAMTAIPSRCGTKPAARSITASRRTCATTATISPRTCASNWPRIGPQLVGKLHFYAGDMDNFYLDIGRVQGAGFPVADQGSVLRRHLRLRASDERPRHSAQRPPATCCARWPRRSPRMRPPGPTRRPGSTDNMHMNQLALAICGAAIAASGCTASSRPVVPIDTNLVGAPTPDSLARLFLSRFAGASPRRSTASIPTPLGAR